MALTFMCSLLNYLITLNRRIDSNDFCCLRFRCVNQRLYNFHDRLLQ